MAKTLVMAMQKGGTGKTTTTLNLGVELAKAGQRVLLIDIDPQANLTSGLGVNPAKLKYSVYEVLLNSDKGCKYAITQTEHGVDLIGSTLALAGAELELAGKIGREFFLREALTQVASDYDYILIDPPPSLGLFTVNAMVAADAVLVPLQAHSFALDALGQLEATIKLVQKLNQKLIIGGLVVTFYDKRTVLSREIDSQVRERYSGKVFNTTIPLTTRLAEAPAAGEPIGVYAPGSTGATAYHDLAGEVLQRYG